MSSKPKPRVVALEEHYVDADIVARFGPGDGTRAPHIVERLENLGELRLEEMASTPIRGRRSSSGISARVCRSWSGGINHSFSRPGNKPGLSFRDVFCEHFHITTSGNFSDPALLCSVMEMGVDRILFSVDWPFVPNLPGTTWIDRVPFCAEDRAKILGGNAQRLLRL